MRYLYRDIDFKMSKEKLDKILDSNENDFNENFLNEIFVLYLRLINRQEPNKPDVLLKLIDFQAIQFNKEGKGKSRGSTYADIDFYDITNKKNFNFGERMNSDYIKNIVIEKIKDYSKNIRQSNSYWNEHLYSYWNEQLYYEQIQIPKKKYIIEPIDDLNNNLADNKCYFLIRDTEKISNINDTEFKIDDDEFGKMIKDGTFQYIGNYDSSKENNIKQKIDDYKKKYKFYFSTNCDSLLGSIFIYDETTKQYNISDKLIDAVIPFGGKRKHKTHNKTHKNKKPKNTKRKHTKKYKN